MAHHVLDGRVFFFRAVLAQEGNGEVHAHHPVRVAYRVQLSVGEVARGRTQGVSVRVGSDERCLRYTCTCPRSHARSGAEVEQDTKPVALEDELLPRICQPWARIRRRWEPGRGRRERGRVGPAPHEAERAEAHLVEVFQSAGVRGRGSRRLRSGGSLRARLRSGKTRSLEQSDDSQLVFGLGLQVERTPTSSSALLLA